MRYGETVMPGSNEKHRFTLNGKDREVRSWAYPVVLAFALPAIAVVMVAVVIVLVGVILCIPAAAIGTAFSRPTKVVPDA